VYQELPVEESVDHAVSGHAGADLLRGRHVTDSRTVGGNVGGRAGGSWGRAASIAAGVLVWCALVLPGQPLPPPVTALVRVPVEGLVVLGLLLVLRRRPARLLSLVAGVALGLVVVLGLVDAGVRHVLDRPLHLVTDVPLLGNGVDYVRDTWGRSMALLVQVAAVLLVALVITVTVSCLLRIERLVRHHRWATAQVLAALAPIWLVAAALDADVGSDRPVAARSAIGMVDDQVALGRQDLRDNRDYAAQLAPSAASSPAREQLLTHLRGQDVVLAFVESYGRSAVEDPGLAPATTAVLDQGTRRLAAAGFGARSGFLTSPTVGGGSWLAHSTLLSGTWVNSQPRYDQLFASTHSTLVRDFGRAGWRTAAFLPGNRLDWPEGSFYGYDEIYGAGTLGYRGPRFGWSLIPDQYALSALHARELAAPHRAPVLTEIELTSSHKPWWPLPRLVDWRAVGDGSGLTAVSTDRATGTDPAGARERYARAIQYSLSTLISFLATYGTDHTVLIVLGDHQPLPEITGGGASRDVPITIMAKDRAVLDRISPWGWTPGLRPHPDAPVWPMDGFRDRFLTAFGAGTR